VKRCEAVAVPGNGEHFGACDSFGALLETAEELELTAALDAPAAELRAHARRYRAHLQEQIGRLIDDHANWTVADLLSEAEEELRGRHLNKTRKALLGAAIAYFSSQRSRPERSGLRWGAEAREAARARMRAYWQQRTKKLAARVSEARSEDDPPEEMPLTMSADPDTEPMQPEALHAWARQRGIEAALGARVISALQRRDSRLFAGAINQAIENGTIEQLLTSATWVDPRKGRSHLKLSELRKAAWSFLREEAERVARALDSERAWLASPLPADPIERGLVERLRACRAQIREHAPPYEIGTLPGQLSLDPLDEPVVRLVHGAGHWPRLTAIASLVLSEETGHRPLSVTCTCSSRTPCVHALMLVDGVLRQVLDHDKAPLRDAILEAVRMPAWERALLKLDRRLEVLRADREASAEAVLWWKLEQGERGLDLEPLLQQRGKRGMLKPKSVYPSELLGDRLPWLSAIDREVLELVDGRDAARALGSSGDEHLLLRALGKLVGHPRVILDEDSLEPIQVSEGLVELAVSAAGDRLAVGVKLDGRVITSAELRERVVTSGLGDALIDLDATARRCSIIRITPELSAALAAAHTLERGMPLDKTEELLRRLPSLGGAVSFSFDRSIPKREMRPERRIVLRLVPGTAHALEAHVFLRPLAGGPVVRPGEGPIELVASTEDRDLVFARREIGEEADFARAHLRDLLPGLENAGRMWSVVINELEDALELVQRLERAEGITTEWPNDDPWYIGRGATPNDLRVRIEDRVDWFGLEGDIEVDGARVSIAALLEAARDRKRFVKVSGGRWIAIGEVLRRRMESLEPFTAAGKRGVEVSAIGVEEVESAIGDAGAFGRTPRWREVLERLERAKAFEPSLPAGLRAELRPYQVEGHAWLSRLSAAGLGACLADDMGLGKTLQAIATLMDRAEAGPALVVAPTSVTFNWVREIERFAPGLRPILYRGSGRGGLVESAGSKDVLIVSYGLLHRDIDSLKRRSFSTLVLDEAQATKNASSRRAKAARAIQADWRIALTGTPIENHLGELWSIFNVVSPIVLGSWEQFRERFGAPIERRGDKERARALSRLLKPFVLRRTKAEVAKDLPPKTDIRLDVVLSAKEREVYEDARLAAVAHLADIQTGLPDEQQRFHVFAALTRLRQIACHPRLADERLAVRSSKLEAFIQLARSLIESGQRALVFSQFVQHLALIRAALEEAGLQSLYLDGSTPLEERSRLVDRFQSGATPLFLISLKAGGTGLNLTAADNVIILDPWWNPAVEDQAADRAHRIGQTRPVSVDRLVAVGTIEESILELHATKRALVADVLEGTGAAASISTDELVQIIRTGAARATDVDDAADADDDDGVDAAPRKDAAQAEPHRLEASRMDSDNERAAPGGDSSTVDRALEVLERSLRRDADLGALTDTSMRAYIRVGRRLAEIARDDDAASMLSDVESGLRIVSARVERGEIPKSMMPLAGVVLRRWIASLSVGGGSPPSASR
jgi:superfamily II DNA or RNA helicase